MTTVATPAEFFADLCWIDGRPLLETMEPYRLAIFEAVFLTFDPDGRRRYNSALDGRAKKNNKTTDLVLAAFYNLLVVETVHGNACYVIANDEDQAGDDLDLAKKLVAANPVLQAEVNVLAKEIERKDGRGAIRVLPARDVTGLHGKTYLFLGIDEMHGYRDYGVLEALALDPHRPEALMWITTYASIYHREGAPLHDYYKRGIRGDDPRMFFSWYSGDYCTDPACADLPPEQRANPSMARWASPDYLEQQRRRLPAHKFRRLHLNLPGMPDGAYFDPGKVADCIEVGVRQRLPEPNRRYFAFVDMAGGSSDDAVLAIAYHDGRRVVVCAVVSQGGQTKPYDPRLAVEKFAGVLAQYGVHAVMGDDYAGKTFQYDFARFAVRFQLVPYTKHELYEKFEVTLNSRGVLLLDEPRVTEQLLGLVVRGTKIDHMPGEHDDFANSVAGVTWLASQLCYADVEGATRSNVEQTKCDYDPLTRDDERRRSGSSVDARRGLPTQPPPVITIRPAQTLAEWQRDN